MCGQTAVAGCEVRDVGQHDLVQAQAAWNATHQALAAPHPRDTTALRRRLLLLSVRLWWHPYWETVPSVPTAPRARAAAMSSLYSHPVGTSVLSERGSGWM
ncbi:hypothetical protein ABT382_29155 [Streptomyces pharetrae]